MTVRLERREPGLTVVAEWDDENAPDGPHRVTVESAGVGSRTLRRAGRHVDAMTAEFHQEPAVEAFRVMVRQYAENRIAELPVDSDGFHRGLLEIYDKIDNDRRVEAVPVLAAAMRLPEETMRACLLVARQRLGRP